MLEVLLRDKWEVDEMSGTYQKISESAMAGDAEAVRKLAQDALNEGITASDVLNRGLLAGMDIVGNHSK